MATKRKEAKDYNFIIKHCFINREVLGEKNSIIVFMYRNDPTVYFVGISIARVLGYKDPKYAVRDIISPINKTLERIPLSLLNTPSGKSNTYPTGNSKPLTNQVMYNI